MAEPLTGLESGFLIYSAGFCIPCMWNFLRDVGVPLSFLHSSLLHAPTPAPDHRDSAVQPLGFSSCPACLARQSCPTWCLVRLGLALPSLVWVALPVPTLSLGADEVCCDFYDLKIGQALKPEPRATEIKPPKAEAEW